MAEYIWTAVVLLLALCGCVQCIRWVVLRLLLPVRKSGGIWLVPLSGHRTDVEYLVRSIAAHRLWEDRFAPTVYLLDIDADEETRQLAQCACDEVGVVRMVKPSELSKILPL